MEVTQVNEYVFFRCLWRYFLGCLSRTIIQKAKQASPIIQNQLAHETYTTFAVDEQFVLHLEQERLRKENNQ